MASFSGLRTRGVMDSAIERFAPLAGVAFVVFLLAGVFIGGEAPDLGDPASDVADFYVDNGTQLRITTGGGQKQLKQNSSCLKSD